MIRGILAIIGGTVVVFWLLGQCGVPVPTMPNLRQVNTGSGPSTNVNVTTNKPDSSAATTSTQASSEIAKRVEAEQLVGKPGAYLSLNGVKLLTLPVQPGENCDQVKVGVGNTATYDVELTEGVSVVIDAVQVNGMFDVPVHKNGVAWKKGPWKGRVTVLDGAFCPVPAEWHDWALTHRQDVLSSIRVRYNLPPRGFPVLELR